MNIGTAMTRRNAVPRIVTHELGLLAADRTLWAAFALLGILTAYGLANGLARSRSRAEEIRAVAAEESDRLSTLKGRLAAIERDPSAPVSPLDDPRSAAMVGLSTAARHATLTPGPLAALAIGQDDLLPSYVKVSTAGKQTFQQSEETTNPNHLLLGGFDLEFVVVDLFPLAILALSFDLLSAEKEGGTLSLLLSQPIGLGAIVAGKVIARALAVATIALAVTALAFGVSGEASRSAVPWGWWLAVVLAYGAFWFALAVAVNALGRSSSTNALILASAWLGLVLVVPSLVNLVATAWYPVPSRVELVQASRDAARRANEQGTQLLSEFYQGHPELAPGGSSSVDDFQARAAAVQDGTEAALKPLLDRFDEQLGHQQAVIRLARFLSPAILAREAIQDVAGTGRGRHDAFAAQVDAFHDRWRSFFRDRTFRKAPFTTADLEALPAFAFREEPAGEVATRAVVGLLGILVPTAAVGIAGFRGLRRYPIVG